MEKPRPNISSLPYGPHVRNDLDFWQTKKKLPAPLLVWIHGGGFTQNDKSKVPVDLLCGALEAGINVASINYRLSQQAPYPASFEDSARAVQYLRYRAEAWGIDPERVAAGGGSAGAGISLWIGFRPDMADASSSDPVARQSTRLSCMACISAQSSYDPNFIRSIIGGPAWKTDALQLLFRARPEEYDRQDLKKQFADASAINHVTADAPPVFLFYNQPNDPPTGELTAGHGIHHPHFGEVLREKLDTVGVECVLRCREDYEDFPEEFWKPFCRDALEFVKEKLGVG